MQSECQAFYCIEDYLTNIEQFLDDIGIRKWKGHYPFAEHQSGGRSVINPQLGFDIRPSQPILKCLHMNRNIHQL